MKKVLLISFFNSSNIGDRVISEILEKKMSEIVSVYKMDISGKKICPISSEKDTGAQIVNTRRCHFYNLKSIVSLRMPRRLEYAKSCIDECDIVVFAGGNMIMDLERFSYYSFLAEKYVRYARTHNKKVAFLFVGVGRIRNYIQRKRWKYALQNSCMISVRDTLALKKMSDELKIQKDILVWRDPVFLLENTKDTTLHRSIAINVYLEAIAEEEQKLKQLYLYIINELRKEYHIVLYTTETNDNKGLYEVYNALESKDCVDIVCPNTLEALLDVYKMVDVVLATRMHAFIIATTQNIPSVVLSWDDKINGITSDLELADFTFSIRNAYDEKEEIIDSIKRILREHKEISSFISKINQDNKKKFDVYIDMMRTLMEEV